MEPFCSPSLLTRLRWPHHSFLCVPTGAIAQWCALASPVTTNRSGSWLSSGAWLVFTYATRTRSRRNRRRNFFSSILALSSPFGRSSAPRSKQVPALAPARKLSAPAFSPSPPSGRSSAPRSTKTCRPDRYSPVAATPLSPESNVLNKPTPGTTNQEKTSCSTSPQ